MKKKDNNRLVKFCASSLRIPALVMTAASALLPSQEANAATLTWNGATNASWATGFPSTPTSADDLTILGPLNVAGALNINVAASAAANTINITNTAATTLTNTTSGSYQTLTLSSSGTAISTGTGAVAIGSATTSQGVNIALGASQTWNVGAGGLTVNNIISGTGFGITKTGTGALTLAGTNSYTGATAINVGRLTFAGSGSVANSALTIGSKGSSSTALSLTVTPTAAGTTTRSNGLTWNGGIFASSTNQNNFIVNGTSAGHTIENFGALNLNSGLLRGSIVANAATNTRVVFDSLTRSAGTALSFTRSTSTIGANSIASQTANAANIVFTTAPSLTGNGGTGTSLSIIPYANLATATPVTYDANNGLRALNTTTEMVTLTSGLALGSGSAGQNAKIASGTITLSTDTTINSLFGTGGTVAFNSDSTKLVVTSGFIGASVGFTVGTGTAGSNGILDFGNAEGMVFVENTRILVINSTITGSGGLTFVFDNLNSSNASAVLSNANTFTGTTTVLGNRASDMSIKLTNSLALQNTTLDYNNYGGSVTFGNGGTTGQTAYSFGGLQGAQNLNLNNNNTTVGAVALTVGGNNDSTTYSGALTDTVDGGSLIKTGTGTLTLTGASNYTGGTTINAGTLELGNASAVSTSAGAITFGGGTLKYGTGITTDYSARIAAGTSVSAMRIDTGANNVTFGTALTASQSGGLIKSGTGTLTLSNTANAFAGGITVVNGTLTTAGSGGTSALGANAIQLGDSSNSNVTLQLNNWNNLTASNTIDVVGSGTHTIIGTHNNTGQVHIAGGAITLDNNDLTIRNTSLAGWRINGGVTGAGNLIFENNNTSGTGNGIELRSAINNTGAITNDSTGNYNLIVNGSQGGSIGAKPTSLVQNSSTSAFDLNAAINSGTTASVEVRAGSMLLNNTSSLRVANSVAVGSNGTLDVRQSNTIAGLSNISGSGGTVKNNSAADTVLTLGAASGSFTFSGEITDGATNTLGLTKSGDSTQILNGTSTYTGATTVSAGTLLVDGQLGDTAVTVGSTATLGGSGIITGTLHFSSGALLSVNLADPLAITGAVTFDNFGFEHLIGFNVETASEGTYTFLGGSNISLSNIAYTMSNPYVRGDGKIAYFQTGSLQAVIAAVPESQTSLLAVLGSLALLRRRRS